MVSPGFLEIGTGMEGFPGGPAARRDIDPSAACFFDACVSGRQATGTAKQAAAA